MADTARLADGTALEGSLVSIEATRVSFDVKGKTRRLELADVDAIELGGRVSGSPMSRRGQQVIRAPDGTRIAVRDMRVEEGKVSVSTDFGGPLSLPLQRVGLLLRPATHEQPGDLVRAIEAIRVKDDARDTLFVGTIGTELVPVSGILTRLGEGEAILSYEGTESPMPAATVRAIRPAPLAGETRDLVPAVGLVRCTDGSRIAIHKLWIRDGKAWVTSPSLGELALERAKLAGIRFENGQTVQLATLTPRVEQTPYFDEAFPWQKDRAVDGSPLRLDGRTYDTGLGLHARCRLEFALDGRYRRFTAVAGIDDSVRSGTAALTITLDGKPAVTALLDRLKPPEQITLSIKDVETMTILADFADGTFGSGARVDLCDALLRK